MSDLSRLLEDVYQSSSAAPPSEAPAWSSEEALEEAFSEWVPGPPDEAPAQERAMFAGSEDLATATEEPIDWEAAIAAIAPQAVENDDVDDDRTETVPLLDEAADPGHQSMGFGAFELFESVIGDFPTKEADRSDTDTDTDRLLNALEAMDEEEDADEEPVLAAVSAPSTGGWCRDDDDILPTRRGRRFRLTLRR